MLDQHSRLNPDLVIMDVMMPGSNGFEGAYALKQCRPSTKIILLPTYSLPDRVLYPHVDAFVLKSELAEFLLPTIRALFPDRVLGAMGGPERNGGRLG